MSTRRVYLDEGDARTVERAVRYLRVLHGVEQSHTLGDYDQAWQLLGGIDPTDVNQTAEFLDSLLDRYRRGPIKIGGVDG